VAAVAAKETIPALAPTLSVERNILFKYNKLSFPLWQLMKQWKLF